jgi:hypothetical protein
MPVSAQTDDTEAFIPFPAKSFAADSTNAIFATAAKCEYASPSRKIILTNGRKSRRRETDRTVFTLSGICEQLHTIHQKIGVFY